MSPKMCRVQCANMRNIDLFTCSFILLGDFKPLVLCCIEAFLGYFEKIQSCSEREIDRESERAMDLSSDSSKNLIKKPSRILYKKKLGVTQKYMLMLTFHPISISSYFIWFVNSPINILFRLVFVECLFKIK